MSGMSFTTLVNDKYDFRKHYKPWQRTGQGENNNLSREDFLVHVKKLSEELNKYALEFLSIVHSANCLAIMPIKSPPYRTIKKCFISFSYLSEYINQTADVADICDYDFLKNKQLLAREFKAFSAIEKTFLLNENQIKMLINLAH